MSTSIATLRGGLLVVLSAQLAGCATARDVTRGAGLGLAGLGALTMLVALAPEECEDDLDEEDLLFGDDDCEPESYTEEELEARGALVAGGAAAMLLGGGLAAAAVPPKRKPRPAPPAPPAAPPTNAKPPVQGQDRVLRTLIEKRCLPAADAVDLRVPGVRRTKLSVCAEP